MGKARVDNNIANEQWERYIWCRDNGHVDFVKKADVCNNFFAGLQWQQEDLDRLRAARRPALTINKILSTLSTMFGQQIENRSETTFLPKRGGTGETADALNMVWQHIATANQLQWVRSDVFADGAITSRGFYDVRLDFSDSVYGDIAIDKLNPKNVVVDPDAEDYDPDTWNDVFVTRWQTPDDIALQYDREAAAELRTRVDSAYLHGYDSLDHMRDRFSGPTQVRGFYNDEGSAGQRRYVRLLDRQFRELTKSKFFVDPISGEVRRIPEHWDRNRIAAVREQFALEVLTRFEKRIKWRVTADDIVLHDDWSPYKHFTTVPYFPYFRHGRTIGLVENLLGPQELLNKTTSQELHVINTTANSGWKVKTGALTNMTPEELEERGAETGLVLELDDVASAEKITPNQIPTGLERISFKAEEYIKSISNVSDSMQGFDREDVAAKAIAQKRQASNVNFTSLFDNLERSDYFLARNVIDIVQEFYTAPRVLNIIRDPLSGQAEPIEINTYDMAAGRIVNDLSVGEYEIIVTTVPYRASIEDSQFEQAVALRELGVPIPDSVLIENSRLRRKREILADINAAANSPEAQRRAQLETAGAEAEVALKQAQTRKTLADASAKEVDPQLKVMDMQAKAAGADPELEWERMEREHALEVEKMNRKFALEQRQQQLDEMLKADEHARAQEREDQESRARVAQAMTTPQAPTPENENQ
ncbi:hypothetical protein [Caldimonas sp. KR1-144]|uniref:portal protein n=1 Tax=Caldimonas sp. KR1-144 TaxID=3400911 RepID=UPI003C0BCF53